MKVCCDNSVQTLRGLGFGVFMPTFTTCTKFVCIYVCLAYIHKSMGPSHFIHRNSHGLHHVQPLSGPLCFVCFVCVSFVLFMCLCVLFVLYVHKCNQILV